MKPVMQSLDSKRLDLVDFGNARGAQASFSESDDLIHKRMVRFVAFQLVACSLCLLASIASLVATSAALTAPSDGERRLDDVARIAADARATAMQASTASGTARETYAQRFGTLVQELKASVAVSGDAALQRAITELRVEANAFGRPDRVTQIDRVLASIVGIAENALVRHRYTRLLDQTGDRARVLQIAIWLNGGALALLLVTGVSLARYHRKTADERAKLSDVLPGDESDEDLAIRAARLRGRAESLARRHDMSVIHRLSLAEAIESYEAAQETLSSTLSEARGEIERLKVSSMLDELTGALKYPYLVHRVRELLRRLLDDGEPFCLLELDLDNFKDINDTFGHAAGDDALRDFACVLRASCRERDLVIRKSGDEFFVLAPGTDVEEALALGERLRQNVNNHTVVSASAAGDRFEFPLAASIGVLDASLADLDALRRIPDEDMAVREVISYVDAALYRAKHAGKNCVRGYEAGLRVIDIASSETPPDLARINRLSRSRYAHLETIPRERFNLLLAQASEILFPRRLGAVSKATDETDGPDGSER